MFLLRGKVVFGFLKPLTSQNLHIGDNQRGPIYLKIIGSNILVCPKALLHLVLNNRRRPTSVNHPALKPKLPDRCRLSSKLIFSNFCCTVFPWPATISRKEGGRSADDIIVGDQLKPVATSIKYRPWQVRRLEGGGFWLWSGIKLRKLCITR